MLLNTDGGPKTVAQVADLIAKYACRCRGTPYVTNLASLPPRNMMC